MDSFSPTRMLAWLALATGLASSPAELRARSQSDGEMGPVSRAAIGISVSIAPRLGAERAAPAQGQGLEVEHPRQQRLCIWSNAPVGTFSMIASPIGRAAGLAGANGPATLYQLEWRTGEGEGEPVPVPLGRSVPGLVPQSPGACRSAGTSGAGLVVAPAAGTGAAESTASGTLLLLIAPD